MIRSTLLPLLLLVALLAAGCFRTGEDATVETSTEGGEASYRIVATVGMVGDMAAAVAGEHAAVTTLMGEGIDPHLYRATRDDVQALSQADVVLYVGLLLEGKMQDVLERIGRGRPVVAVTSGLGEEVLLGLEDDAGQADPHVWMDPEAWAACVDTVEETLSAFDPGNAEAYAANAAAYREEVLALGEYGRRVLGSVPQDRRVLLTSHDAFRYFGRAFGLEVLGVQGLSTESEAGLSRINRLVDLLVDREIQAVFVESSVPRKSIETLIHGARSRGHEVAIGGTLYSDAMGERGTYEGTYLGMLDHNLTTVAGALGGEAPEAGMSGKLDAADTSE